MKMHHWIGAVVILVVGLYLGINYPSTFAKIPGLSSGA